MLTVAFLVLLALDIPLMRWRYRVAPEGVTGLTQQWTTGLRDFGQPPAMIIIGLIVIIVDRRWKGFILALVLAQVGVLAVCHTSKWALPRYRPYAAIEVYGGPAATPEQQPDPVKVLARMHPSDTWSLHDPGGWPPPSGQNSFPSAHSAAAFALAAVLAAYYPRLRWVFWALALGCAASRFVDAVHWPSDCLVGSVVGCLLGGLALRLPRCRVPNPGLAVATDREEM